jgi:hypothetical protein
MKQSAQRRVYVWRHEDAPSCRVKVAFCGLTAATTPCTSVFGGFCRVTMTEIPMKPDAMAAEGFGRELWEFDFDDLSGTGGVRCGRASRDVLLHLLSRMRRD